MQIMSIATHKGSASINIEAIEMCQWLSIYFQFV